MSDAERFTPVTIKGQRLTEEEEAVRALERFKRRIMTEWVDKQITGAGNDAECKEKPNS